MSDLLAPMPTPKFQLLVDEFRGRVDDLTISQVAGALAAYAVNLAQSNRGPMAFEVAHIVALAQRAGMPLDAAAVRQAWVDTLPSATRVAEVEVARPRGLLARLKLMLFGNAL